MKTGFKSVPMIAAALASVLGCYMVSLSVSAERAAVDRARAHAARDLADIRLLQAELRTRARLPELQRWNEQVLALAPPRAEQFLGNPVMLARFAAPPAPAAVVQVAVVRDAAPAQPSPVRAVAYAVPAAKPPVHKVVVAAAAPPRLDADFVAAISAAASAERPGFQKIALR